MLDAVVRVVLGDLVHVAQEVNAQAASKLLLAIPPDRCATLCIVANDQLPEGSCTQTTFGVQVVTLPNAAFMYSVSSAVSGSESQCLPRDIARSFQP